MKTKSPSNLQVSDFQRWLMRETNLTRDKAIEVCRAGNRKEYVRLFNQWQNAKREPMETKTA